MDLQPECSAAFREWLNKPLGRSFLDLEYKRIGAVMPTLYGYDALLIGEPQFSLCMQQSVIKNKFILHDDLSLGAVSNCKLVNATQEQIPIGTGLIDLVYLAHSLEFARDPKQVLTEAYRIMRADGHLLISVFNPQSIWGVWGSMGQIGNDVAWKSNFISIAKLKDWLALLGFDIMQVNYFGFNLPLNKSKCSDRLSIFERCGQKLELPFGAAYLIEASKRVVPMTPVNLAWRDVASDIIEDEDDVTEPTANT
jgi:SAM-dependent methyltransferase